MGNPHRDKARRQKRNEYSGNSMGDAFQRRYGSMDVSVDGRRDGRRDGPRDGHRDRYDDRPPRPKLTFQQVHQIEQGDCRCIITAAEGMRGTIYNFSVERIGRDRPSRFFRDGDAGDLAALVVQAGQWIESQKTTNRS